MNNSSSRTNPALLFPDNSCAWTKFLPGQLLIRNHSCFRTLLIRNQSCFQTTPVLRQLLLMFNFCSRTTSTSCSRKTFSYEQLPDNTCSWITPVSRQYLLMNRSCSRKTSAIAQLLFAASHANEQHSCRITPAHDQLLFSDNYCLWTSSVPGKLLHRQLLSFSRTHPACEQLRPDYKCSLKILCSGQLMLINKMFLDNFCLWTIPVLRYPLLVEMGPVSGNSYSWTTPVSDKPLLKKNSCSRTTPTHVLLLFPNNS